MVRSRRTRGRRFLFPQKEKNGACHRCCSPVTIRKSRRGGKDWTERIKIDYNTGGCLKMRR